MGITARMAILNMPGDSSPHKENREIFDLQTLLTQDKIDFGVFCMNAINTTHP